MTAPNDQPMRLVDPRLVVRPDRHLIRAYGRSERFLLVEVVAPTVRSDEQRRRPPVNLAFVLDRSGSMGAGNKLPLAKQATLESIDRLDDADRFAVVTYDDQVDVVSVASDATSDARRTASRALATVEPRGSTNLHAGWLTGCEQVAGGLVERGVNRVLLLTDGLANVGVTDREELARLAFDLRKRGVTTSTFGVGVDFDEQLLQGMADSGGGHFYFAGDVAQMRDHITSEVGETLEVVAREVALELVLPESVRVDSLSPFRIERAGGRARMLLGDMVSGQVLTIALRLTFDYGDIGREVGALVRVADRDGAFENATPALAPVSIAWQYADHAANDAQPREVEVDRMVAQLFAERARQEAVRLNREGRFDDARRALAGVQQRVAGYAKADTRLNEIVAELAAEQPRYAAPMPELSRKRAYYASSLACRARMPDGKSTRADKA
jgi:Ca-activated chloride channel family protein